MNYLYLLLNIATISVPLMASYHPKIKFHKNHRALFTAIISSGLVFILWDVLFTKKEVWGFSDSFTLGFSLFGLPIEEWLFFICIPYASLFLHFQLYKFNWLNPFLISNKTLKWITYILSVVVFAIGVLNYDKLYTFVDSIVFVLVLFTAYTFYRNELRKFIVSFILILIPFFIVNGLLTGTALEEAIVWYDAKEQLGIRLGTIPIEDAFYAFSMLMLPLMIYYKLNPTSIQGDSVEH